MAASPPAQTIAKGKEFVILIKKPNESDFKLIGCLSKYDFDATVEAIDVACRAYSGKGPNGDDAQWQVAMEGITHVYPADQVEANVSSLEIEKFLLAQNIIELKIGGTKVGDPIRTGKGFFSSYKETADQKGNVTYNATLVGLEIYTISTVTA